MTTVVKKGTGRPAHAARKTKHAQRNVVVGGKRDDALLNALNPTKKGTAMSKEPPAPRFVMFGKGKVVHVIHTKAYDLKNGQCPTVRKNIVAGNVDYKKSHKGLSPEATLALPTCTNCGTEVVAQRLIPEETKRAARKDKRDEVMDRAKASKPKSKSSKVKESKPKPDRKPTKAMAGFRSTGSGYEDKTQGKAEELAQFARDNGWSAKATEDKPRWRVNATKGNQTIVVWFLDGKFDLSFEGYLEVGNWRGKLRAAHAVRRQIDMALDDRMRPHPHPGAGRSVARSRKADIVPEDESPEDAAKRVPFSVDDDPIVIVDMLLGKRIQWRNGVSNTVEEAVVPSEVRGKGKHCKRDKVTLTEHPKTGKRMLDFLVVDSANEDGEVYGPERVVALEKIIRVLDN